MPTRHIPDTTTATKKQESLLNYFELRVLSGIVGQVIRYKQKYSMTKKQGSSTAHLQLVLGPN